MPRRMGQAESNLESRGKIVALYQAGVSKQEIALQVDLSVRLTFNLNERFTG